MDSAELDRRFRTHDGWIPPDVVAALVEHGHLAQVRAQAEQGDWFCARAWARTLSGDQRLEVLRPFADSGWWAAVETVAGLLEESGRSEEAIALVRPHAEAGDRLAVRGLAELLAGQGRIDEVIALLGPGVGDWYLEQALVDLTEGHGRDEEMLALLPVVEPECGCSRHWGDTVRTAGLRARVLERMGRVDEAVTLLRAHVHRDNVTYGNAVEQLADVLARHGRITDLRDLAAGYGGLDAARRLAGLLEEECPDEAVEVLRTHAADGSPNAAWCTAELLRKHGRVDEAIEVLRAAARRGADDWIIHELGELLVGQGRADEALAVVDDIAGRLRGDMGAELLLERVRLLAACGRHGQAVAELRAHPEADGWYMAKRLAELLAEAGRLDEAVAELRPGIEDGRNRQLMAKLLIRQGRAEEAVTTARVTRPTTATWGSTSDDADDPWSTEPPF
ncbi:tetratricopeptide repeat protein [Streptomyces yaanensis]|uniref:Tetratricopeptide repeat protein n=1 Tax=Streptomyces yaanensis TaxID=1142239 RepID=A0ABV7SI97_9ACTN|nr:hypothetical protein [Streptomyces sp. CGMCC 4.7035]WNC01640.1 hypothetical protein Q2K21_28220 [Streptomyces sp. CGMCC 4.7035]